MITGPELIQSILGGLMTGAIYAIVAVGLNAIFGVVKIVNFAQGEFLMQSMYVTFWLFTLLGINPLISIAVNALLFFVLGLGVFRVFIRGVVNAGDYPQIAMTIGLSTLLIGLAEFFWSPNYRGIFIPLSIDAIRFSGFSVGAPQFLALLYSVIVTILLEFILRRTDIGRAMRAVAQDELASRVIGIDTNRTFAFAWALGTALTSASAGIIGIYLYTYPTVGQDFIIYAFIVVVLGGLGSYVGAILGAVTLGIIQSVSSLFISSELGLAVVYIVFVFILLFRPKGILGKEAKR